MIALRIVGGVFAVTLLVGAARQYQRRNVSRLSLIITWLVGGLIVVLAVAPVVFNPVFDVFKFKKGTGGRLIGVLLFANVVAFFLLFRNMSTIDSAARSVRLLIEALSLQAFDRKQAEDLPAGQRVVVIMPAFNEAENVGAVIHAMPEEVEGYPVVPLVIDDASEDATSHVARSAGAMVARLPIRRGGGLALRVGYDIAVQLD